MKKALLYLFVVLCLAVLVVGGLKLRQQRQQGLAETAPPVTAPWAAGEFAPEAGVAHRFFAKLLPEGAVRDHIVRDLKQPNTDFDLLRAIGGECAGALSMLANNAGVSPSNREKGEREGDSHSLTLLTQEDQAKPGNLGRPS